MGRGVVTFSISSAIALASYTPTQMGRTVLPFTSFRMTMGMLVTGSIMSPRIFISTSMSPPPTSLHHSYGFTHQGVGPRARNPYRQVLSHQRIAVGGRVGEVEGAVVRGAADPLAERLVAAFDHHFARGANHLRVAPDLD